MSLFLKIIFPWPTCTKLVSWSLITFFQTPYQSTPSLAFLGILTPLLCPVYGFKDHIPANNSQTQPLIQSFYLQSRCIFPLCLSYVLSYSNSTSPQWIHSLAAFDQMDLHSSTICLRLKCCSHSLFQSSATFT